MKKITIIYGILFLCAGILVQCSGTNDKPIAPKEQVFKETDFLVEAIHKSSFFNHSSDFTITAQELNNLSEENVLILDLNNPEEFKKQHIKNAKNIAPSKLFSYLKTKKDANNYQKIVLVCNNGMNAAFNTGLLRLAGYDNVYTLRFGLSAWNKQIEDWKQNTAQLPDKFIEIQNHEKNKQEKLPTVLTKKLTGKDILASRIEHVSRYGFKKMAKSIENEKDNLNKYYIICLSPVSMYELGHLPAAVHYQPSSLNVNNDLKTLPLNQTILIYCQTGMTSAYYAAYLKVLGYDVNVLKYGANSFMYDKMKANGSFIVFDENQINDFELEKNNIK